eukprot:634069_1
MGRRKKSLHPADQYRKIQRKRTLKKNKAERTKIREESLLKRNSEQLMGEIRKLQQLESDGLMTEKLSHRRQKLLKAHAAVLKREKDETSRREEDRVEVKGLGRIVRRAPVEIPSDSSDSDSDRSDDSEKENGTHVEDKLEELKLLDEDDVPFFPPGLAIPPEIEKPPGLGRASRSPLAKPCLPVRKRHRWPSYLTWH